MEDRHYVDYLGILAVIVLISPYFLSEFSILYRPTTFKKKFKY